MSIGAWCGIPSRLPHPAHVWSGDMLVLETKGRGSDRDRIKRRFLAEWIAAVNPHGGFGRWRLGCRDESRRNPRQPRSPLSP